LDIAYHLHITPRVQDQLTMGEWEAAVQAVKDIRAEIEKAK